MSDGTNESETLSEYLPQVRCTASLKRRLERIVADKRLGQLSDHIRLAVEEYVERHEGDEPEIGERSGVLLAA